MTPEPFLPADQTAKLLGIKRRLLLSRARQGMAGAYAVSGELRHVWVFKWSEVIAGIDPNQRFRFPNPSQVWPGYDLP